MNVNSIKFSTWFNDKRMEQEIRIFIDPSVIHPLHFQNVDIFPLIKYLKRLPSKYGVHYIGFGLNSSNYQYTFYDGKPYYKTYYNPYGVFLCLGFRSAMSDVVNLKNLHSLPLSIQILFQPCSEDYNTSFAIIKNIKRILTQMYNSCH